jgi:NagD protein
MRLADARGFMFDLDGTLVARTADGAVPMPGAVEVVESIRASGRPLVVFTNASHVTPDRIAAGVRRGGLDIRSDEVLTPVVSAIGHLTRRHAGARVLVIGTDAASESMRAAGVDVRRDGDAEVVLVLHTDRLDLPVLEDAAHAVIGGATFLAGNYARAYAGANGPILSRGAMAAAAIAHASATEPTVVGKPSRAAVQEVSARLGVPSADVAVIGDDVDMDIALGRLGDSRTVLVRSGISADANGASADLVLDGVADLIDLL